MAVNRNVAVLPLIDPLGPDVIVVSGAVVSLGAEALPIVIALTTVALSPSASVTVRRTFLVPASEKVNDMVLPLPSGHWPPPAPSVPSSTHE